MPLPFLGPSNLQTTMNSVADSAVTMSIAASVGYCCARVFTSVNPVHGAVFCAVSSLVTKFVNPIFEKFFAGKGANEASKMLGVGLSIVSGIAASAAVSTAFGFPITFYAGFVLTCTVVSIIAIATFAYSFATAPSAA